MKQRVEIKSMKNIRNKNNQMRKTKKREYEKKLLKRVSDKPKLTVMSEIKKT